METRKSWGKKSRKIQENRVKKNPENQYELTNKKIGKNRHKKETRQK